MHNIHPISEDVEPPSTDGRRSDVKGYRASKTPVAHESIHGRNFIFKTYPFKKSRLEIGHSLSSCFAPFIYRAAENNSQFGERAGLFDEDDEYPPSAFSIIKSRIYSLSGNVKTRTSLNEATGISVTLRKADTRLQRHAQNLPTKATKISALGEALSGAVCSLAFLFGCPSFVSWFRSVPIGRLAPPGFVVC
jgi:hypothetical protein